jgi:death-on-curing protein
VSARRVEPRWLTREELQAIHEAQLRTHGGSSGARDEGLIESALARPRNKFAYAPRADLAQLAAAYAFGIAKNHGFVDGNKRSALMAGYTFLGVNGYEFERDEADVASTIEGLASGRITEAALKTWFKSGMIKKIKPR